MPSHGRDRSDAKVKRNAFHHRPEICLFLPVAGARDSSLAFRARLGVRKLSNFAPVASIQI